MTPLPRMVAPERERIAEPSLFARAVELVGLRAERRRVWLERRGADFDDVEAEQTFVHEHEGLAAINLRIAALERELDDDEPRLDHLRALIHLEPDEVDLLLGCLAAAIEPALGQVFARLQGRSDRCYPTEPLLARLFGWGRQLLLRGGSELIAWGIVHRQEVAPGEPPVLSLDPFVLAWLSGRPNIDAELVGIVQVRRPKPPLPSWPLARLLERLRLAYEDRRARRFVLVGPPGSGRRSLASTATAAMGLAPLLVDVDAIDDARWSEHYLRANRLALLLGGLVIWHGARLDRRWPRLGATPLQIIVCEDPHAIARHPDLVDEIIELPALGLDERRELWTKLVPGTASWPSATLDHLAARHRLTVGDLAEIAERTPSDPEHAALLAREQTRGQLGELGRLLDCPFSADDLIVGDKVRETLDDFIFEAAERASFWEQANARRLFPRGTGLVGLFTGPPGTGKTMAAQVIAAELQLDLFRIDLATVVSKYIGETAKNLERIFARAGRMNAVLLFDEADALFAKRTDVRDSHDRYANADTNYLLQLLEDYRGIALLASNKKNNLDPAFTRRIRFILDFPRPDAGQRRTIWRRVVGELAGPEVLRRLEPAIARLAEVVDVSGAQIKNALLAALFASRRTKKPLDVEHILRGLDRELVKEGRALHERERARLLRPG